MGGLDPLARLQQAPITAARGPLADRLEIRPVEGVGGVLHHQGRPPAGKGSLQPLEPLAHGGCGGHGFAFAPIPAAPAHHQVVPGREQRLHQHIAVLIRRLGIPQATPVLHQVEAGALALPGELAGIEAHQHDHPVGNGPHRLEGADGDGPTAVAEAS